MIVADANLIAYFAIEGTKTAQARAVFAKDRVCLAPTLWESEVLSILSGMLRRKEASSKSAELSFLYARSLMRSHTVSIDFRRVLAVSQRTSCSGYDSQYVAVAEEHGLKLVTNDGGIQTNAPHVAISFEDFLAN